MRPNTRLTTRRLDIRLRNWHHLLGQMGVSCWTSLLAPLLGSLGISCWTRWRQLLDQLGGLMPGPPPPSRAPPPRPPRHRAPSRTSAGAGAPASTSPAPLVPIAGGRADHRHVDPDRRPQHDLARLLQGGHRQGRDRLEVVERHLQHDRVVDRADDGELADQAEGVGHVQDVGAARLHGEVLERPHGRVGARPQRPPAPAGLDPAEQLRLEGGRVTQPQNTLNAARCWARSASASASEIWSHGARPLAVMP